MPGNYLCVICKTPITDPDFLEPRWYELNEAPGVKVRQRCCCDGCWAQHAAAKPGLKGPVDAPNGAPPSPIPLLLVALVLGFFMSSCAPYGPWPFSTEAQRERLLLREGMTVAECTAKKGGPVAGPLYNPSAEGYDRPALPSDFTGVAYYAIDGSLSDEECAFQNGRIIAIKYVRSPWAGYDTWQRRQLTWNSD